MTVSANSVLKPRDNIETADSMLEAEGELIVKLKLYCGITLKDIARSGVSIVENAETGSSKKDGADDHSKTAETAAHERVDTLHSPMKLAAR